SGKQIGEWEREVWQQFRSQDVAACKGTVGKCRPGPNLDLVGFGIDQPDLLYASHEVLLQLTADLAYCITGLQNLRSDVRNDVDHGCVSQLFTAVAEDDRDVGGSPGGWRQG